MREDEGGWMRETGAVAAAAAAAVVALASPPPGLSDRTDAGDYSIDRL